MPRVEFVQVIRLTDSYLEPEVRCLIWLDDLMTTIYIPSTSMFNMLSSKTYVQLTKR
jgi:hypothetical protein